MEISRPTNELAKSHPEMTLIIDRQSKLVQVHYDRSREPSVSEPSSPMADQQQSPKLVKDHHSNDSNNNNHHPCILTQPTATETISVFRPNEVQQDRQLFENQIPEDDQFKNHSDLICGWIKCYGCFCRTPQCHFNQLGCCNWICGDFSVCPCGLRYELRTINCRQGTSKWCFCY